MWQILKVLVLSSVLISCTRCGTISAITNPPKVKVTDVKLKSARDSDAIVDIILQVENPNSRSVSVSGLKYSLSVDDKEIAQGVFEQEVELPAVQTINVAIPVTVKYQDLFSSVMNMLFKKAAPYRARGSVDVGPFTIPFDETGELKIKDL